MNLRDELVQCAAVAVATIEDLDSGNGAAMENTDVILQQIEYERQRQNDKWGPQHHPMRTWLAILMEEVGEVARELLDEHIK